MPIQYRIDYERRLVVVLLVVFGGVTTEAGDAGV
jgi:hypothetical protein